MYAKNQLQLVFQQSWTGLLKDWLQLVATSSVASCLVFRNLATSPVASCLKFGQKDWTGLDFKTLVGIGQTGVGTVMVMTGQQREEA